MFKIILFILSLVFTIIITFRFMMLCISFFTNIVKAIRLKKSLGAFYNDNQNKSNQKCLILKQIAQLINGINKYSNNLISKIPFHFARIFCYKVILGVRAKRQVVIYSGTIFRDGFKRKIGEGTVIGDNCVIDSRGGVSIGKHCNLSSDVRIWTAQHDVNARGFDYVKASVNIDDRCWISSNVTVLPGVSIGEGAVIASGAVVTKDCEACSIYAGIPAKKIGNRNKDIDYYFDGSHDWFL